MVQRYTLCSRCNRFTPYMQRKCENCGRHFNREDKQFRTCPMCGSLNPSDTVMCACGHIQAPMDRSIITRQDLTDAYHNGEMHGIVRERQRLDALVRSIEWERQTAFRKGREQGVREERMWQKKREAQFFKDAQLKNTLNGEPITCMEDFRKWKTAFDAAKREIAARKQREQAEEAERKRREQAEQKAAEQRKSSYPHMDYPPKPKAVVQEPEKPEVRKGKRSKPQIAWDAIEVIKIIWWIVLMASMFLAGLFAELEMETPAIISMAVFFLTIGGAAIMYIAAVIYGLFGGSTGKAAGRAGGAAQKQKPEKKQEPRKPLRVSHVVNGIMGVIAGVSVVVASILNQIGYEDGYAVAGAIFVASTAYLVIANYKYHK